MKNLPPAVRFIILAGALVGIGVFWFMSWKTATEHPANSNNQVSNSQPEADQPSADNTNTIVDFTKTGYITLNNPGLKENTPYFIFEEPGSPALSKELIFDEKSICVSSADTLPCLAMNTTLDAAYGDKRVAIEGMNQSDGSLLVRKLSLEQ